jgi:hypothetical protein
MPVRTNTITPPIPYAQYKPGKRGKCHSDQMYFPGFWKNPSHNIEQRESCMKNKKEDV